MLFRLPLPGRHPRCPRLHSRWSLFLAFTVVISLWLLLPYDNSVRQAVRFNLDRLWRVLGPRPNERWVFEPPRFPVDLGDDVVVIAKTGYGTRERMRAWFDALSPKSAFRDFLVVGDYASQPGQHLAYGGRDMPVYDVANRTLENLALSGKTPYPRVTKYQSLIEAVRSGDEKLALERSREFGWELDVLKDISGFEFAYERFPHKKWFILADDDTYLVQPSLKALLAHLDSGRPHYLGNAIGDYRIRFAHGGSTVILSQAAVRLLFVGNPQVVSAAHREALSEVWGDRLIARTLVRTGVFLDERYSHFFSGEPPRHSKIRTDWACSPILSFHGLATPERMLDAGAKFRDAETPPQWLHLWDIFGAPSTSSWHAGSTVARQDWDHVGQPDEDVVIVHGAATAQDCTRECESRSKSCMAWTWDQGTRDCLISSWMIVGAEATGKITGVNSARVEAIHAKCDKR